MLLIIVIDWFLIVIKILIDLLSDINVSMSNIY